MDMKVNATEILNEIKALFNEQGQDTPNPEEGKVEMADYTLEDGTKIKISALEVGGMVTLEDGTPAPQGEHKLADGTSIQVDETGAIVEIASPKEDTMPEEETPAPAPAPTGMSEEQMASLKAELEALIGKKFEEIAKANETNVANLNAFESKVKEGFGQVTSLLESLVQEPKAEPTEKTSAFGSFKTNADKKLEQINRFKKAIK